MKLKDLLFLFVLFLLIGCNPPKKQDKATFTGLAEEKQTIALAIHGGAGTIKRENMTEEQEAKYRKILAQALNEGFSVLEAGGSALDAVMTAVKIMEDSPLFNAGKGAVFTHDGRNEMDAAIMDGKTKNAGAVAGITRVKNPITAAYAVMVNSPHVFLMGDGAEVFAQEQGLELVDPSYFRVEERYEQLLRILEQEKKAKEQSIPMEKEKEKLPSRDREFGTVGAVAVDQNGNLAAATSTGGMANKRYGRVGDVPVIGAGTYADNETCAVSATGHGEFFIMAVVGHEIAAQIKHGGKSLPEAAEDVVMNQLVEMKGEGGVIGIDRNGTITMPFNSQGMYRGYIREMGQGKTFIFSDEIEGL